MACQLLKDRKAAGEIIHRLVPKVEKVLKQIKDGTLTGDETQEAVDALQEVALLDYQKVIGNNGAGE